MKKELVQVNNMQIMGISTRTNNSNEMNPNLSKIGPLVNQYRSENMGNSIPHSKNPGVTFSIYTDYDHDEHGDYTYLIGEEVFNIEEIPNGLKLVGIPAGNYQKFTTGPGKMPEVVIDAWLAIWKMSPEELGGQRCFITDFEIYDKRAVDPQKTIVDIYIGIK